MAAAPPTTAQMVQALSAANKAAHPRLMWTNQPAEFISLVDYGLPEIAPDGGYPEGTNYWGYANRLFTMMLGSLDSVIGSDLGFFTSLPSVQNTGFFYANLVEAPLASSVGTGECRPAAIFNDGGQGVGNQSALFYYAFKYKDPFLFTVAKNLVSQSPDGRGLLQPEGCGEVLVASD